MSRLDVTSADRDEFGRIRITPAPPRAHAPVPQPDAPTVARADRPRWPLLLAGVLLAAALIALTQWLQRPAAVLPLPPPVVLSPVPTSERSTQPQPVAHGLPRAVVAYAAPGGDVLGSIEPGRAYTPTGQFADGWLQLDAAGSGAVWIRGAELPEVPLPTATPTLTPLPTDTPAPVPPTPIPPPPTTCAANLYGSACGWGDVQATVDAIQAHAEATQAAQRATLEALPTPTPVAPPPAQTIR